MCAGPGDGTLEDQWVQLGDSKDVLALAPDDELLAETMALQSELLQQMLVNRRCISLPGFYNALACKRCC